jgi:hypothetical protein
MSLHHRLDGDAATAPNLATVVKPAPLNTTIGPSEILVGTPVTKLADLSSATSNSAQVTIQNRAAFSIFWCYGTPGTPTGLTTGTGVELPTNSFLSLDGIGGLCVWAISGTPQTSGSGTRVTAGDLV